MSSWNQCDLDNVLRYVYCGTNAHCSFRRVFCVTAILCGRCFHYDNSKAVDWCPPSFPSPPPSHLVAYATPTSADPSGLLVAAQIYCCPMTRQHRGMVSACKGASLAGNPASRTSPLPPFALVFAMLASIRGNNKYGAHSRGLRRNLAAHPGSC